MHLGQKLRLHQLFNVLNMYENIGATSGAILEKILEWDGSLDEFSIELSTHFPLFSGNNPNSIEKELRRSAKTHFGTKKHRDMMKLLDQPLEGDISGITGCTILQSRVQYQFSKKYSTKSFLEKILKWDGSSEEFSIELSTHFPLFSDNNLDSIKKEMLRSAKTYFSSKKHRDVMKLLDQPLRGDISGITGCTILQSRV